MEPALKAFEDTKSWAAAAAGELADALNEAIRRSGQAVFAAAGGGTPGPILTRLAADPGVDWTKLTITTTDDRKVPEDHPARNLVMLRACMAAAESAGAEIKALEEMPPDAAPDVVLLGFGLDAHVASIFPAGAGMDIARALQAPYIVETTPEPLPPEAPFARVTWSMRALAEADLVVIAAAGADKRRVWDRAVADMPGEPPTASPLAQALTVARAPVQMLWRA